MPRKPGPRKTAFKVVLSVEARQFHENRIGTPIGTHIAAQLEQAYLDSLLSKTKKRNEKHDNRKVEI